MAEFLVDKDGSHHQLDSIHSITPAIEKDKDGKVVSKHAVLYFHSGNALHTRIPFKDAIKAWAGKDAVPAPKAPVEDDGEDDE